MNITQAAQPETEKARAGEPMAGSALNEIEACSGVRAFRAFISPMSEVYQMISDCPKPSVAALHAWPSAAVWNWLWLATCGSPTLKQAGRAGDEAGRTARRGGHAAAAPADPGGDRQADDPHERTSTSADAYEQVGPARCRFQRRKAWPPSRAMVVPVM
jgi:hypothetical protein